MRDGGSTGRIAARLAISLPRAGDRLLEKRGISSSLEATPAGGRPSRGVPFFCARHSVLQLAPRPAMPSSFMTTAFSRSRAHSSSAVA